MRGRRTAGGKGWVRGRNRKTLKGGKTQWEELKSNTWHIRTQFKN